MSKILALEGEWEKNPKYKIGIVSTLRFIQEVLGNRLSPSTSGHGK